MEDWPLGCCKCPDFLISDFYLFGASGDFLLLLFGLVGFGGNFFSLICLGFVSLG